MVRTSGRDGGFGLVEIIVSMMLLALLLVSLAPLLVQGLRASARAATIAFATQAVNERLHEARAASQDCTTFQEFIDTDVPPTLFDARGVEITLTQEPATGTALSCPGAGVQFFGVRATSAVTGEDLAEAKTAIAVPGW